MTGKDICELIKDAGVEDFSLRMVVTDKNSAVLVFERSNNVEYYTMIRLRPRSFMNPEGPEFEPLNGQQ